MKDRLTTLLIAIGALLLATFLLMPPTPDSNIPLSLPTSVDPGSDGLKGLHQWLIANQIPEYSLRKRYGALAENTELEADGNLLIMSMPQQKPALKSEWSALSNWLKQGNSLVILSAAYNKPNWAEENSCFCEIKKLLRKHDWTLDKNPAEKHDNEGSQDELTLTKTIDRLKAGVASYTPIESTQHPLPKIAILDSITAISGQLTPALVAQHWQLKSRKPEQATALRLLTHADDQSIATLWQINNGKYPIYLSLLPDLFANKNLDKADNATLIANIIGQNLGVNGRVIFDDYHFGLSDLYDPERFFSDPRLHLTLAFLGLLWILYVIGYSNRLAPIRSLQKRPSTGDLVDAMAGFFSHRIDQRSLARELVEHLIQDVRRQRHLPDNKQTWLWLDNHPQVPTEQLLLLKNAHSNQPTTLDQLTHTITHIRITLLL